MIVLGYIGDHAADSLSVRMGWAVTRLAQRGRFKQVTHVEGYYGTDENGRAIIASASVRDGGVRIKHTSISMENWIAIDVPSWDAKSSIAFVKSHVGKKYDMRGALATVLLSGHSDDRWFCNEIIGASVGVTSPEIFGPAQFMALAVSIPGAAIVSGPLI